MENDSSSQEYWLKKLYRKSESTRTVKVAKVSLKTFDLFCKDQGYSIEVIDFSGYDTIEKLIESIVKNNVKF